MSAFTEAIREPKARGGQPELIPQYLQAMPRRLRTQALALLNSEQSDGVVAAAFTTEGYPLAGATVRGYRERHRIGRFAR